MRKVILLGRTEGSKRRRDCSKMLQELKELETANKFTVEDWTSSESTGLTDDAIFEKLRCLAVEDVTSKICIIIDGMTIADFGLTSNHGTSERRDRNFEFALKVILSFPRFWCFFIPEVGDRTVWSGGDDDPFHKIIDSINYTTIFPRCTDGEDTQKFAKNVEQYIRDKHTLFPENLANRNLRILQIFLEGYNPIFDPTGLRCLLKIFQLRRTFDDQLDNKSNRVQERATRYAIRQLGERLRHVSICVDDEPEMADISGYSCYRHGRRVWTISKFSTLTNGSWLQDNEWAKPYSCGSALIVRDLDLQFKDSATNTPELHNLQNWPEIFNDAGPETDNKVNLKVWMENAVWRVNSSSLQACTPAHILSGKTEKQFNWASGIMNDEELQEKKDEERRLLGVQKPLPNLLFTSTYFFDAFNRPDGKKTQHFHKSMNHNHESHRVVFDLNDKVENSLDSNLQNEKADDLKRVLLSQRTLIARLDLRNVGCFGKSMHAAKPTNLTIANALLKQCRVLSNEKGRASSMYGAICAQEAYELLLGKSIGDAVEALLHLHSFETKVETISSAFSTKIDMFARKQDIELTLSQLFGFDRPEKIEQETSYSAKIWTYIRTNYRENNFFDAADSANLEILSNQTWLGIRGSLVGIRYSLIDIGNNLQRKFKTLKSRLFKNPLHQNAQENHILKYHLKSRRASKKYYPRGRRLEIIIRGKFSCFETIKQFLAMAVTRPRQWVKSYIVFITTFTMFYGVKFSESNISSLLAQPISGAEILAFAKIAVHDLISALSFVSFSSLQNQMSWKRAPTSYCPDTSVLLLDMAFLACNTMLLGALIAVIIRQVTRD